MPVRETRIDAYGQVAGEVTSTVLMVEPSVTPTVVVMVPVPGAAGPARVIVTVLPDTEAVMFGFAELVE